MKIYLDYIFFINFLFDFILLLGVSIILRRNVSKFRLFLGSLFGGVSFFIIFFNMSSFMFFILKMFLAVIMLIITFSYKDLKYTMNNFIYLIILSVLVGGFLYLINIEIGYSHVGMLFFTNGKSLNMILLIFITILLVIIYSKYIKRYKKDNKNRFKTNLYIDNKEYKLNGFLDTGNELFYFNKPCLILNKIKKIDLSSFNTIHIPFTTINSKGLMKGFIAPRVFIEDYGFYENVVVALSNDKFRLGGADIILNINLLEGKYENNNIFEKTIKKKK